MLPNAATANLWCACRLSADLESRVAEQAGKKVGLDLARKRIRAKLLKTAKTKKVQGDEAYAAGNLDSALEAYAAALELPDADGALLNEEPWTSIIEQVKKVEAELELQEPEVVSPPSGAGRCECSIIC